MLVGDLACLGAAERPIATESPAAGSADTARSIGISYPVHDNSVLDLYASSALPFALSMVQDRELRLQMEETS